MRYYAGVDIGGTNIKVGILTEGFDMIAKVVCPTNASRGSLAIAEDIWCLLQQASRMTNVSISEIASIGVGCAGNVNHSNGVVVYSCNLGMVDIPFSQILSDVSKIPVYMDNDANCAILGEKTKGAAIGHHSAIILTLGTGIGGGIIIDGKIYRGFNFFGGEIGHMVIEVDGISCTCGRNGCFERYASAAGLIQMTKEMMRVNPDSLLWGICRENLDQVDGTTAFEGQKQGDKTAKQILNRFFSYLVTGVVNVINIFQPEIMIIGGGLSGQGQSLLEPLKREVYRQIYSKNSVKQTKIVISTLGNDAGIIGAAALAGLYSNPNP